MLCLCSLVSKALADGGAGGAHLLGTLSGGAGGTGFAGENGVPADNFGANSAGGGGGGAGGGDGGDSLNALGGIGGGPGLNGQRGDDGQIPNQGGAGGGGGGNGNGSGSTSLSNTGIVRGGQGGSGGRAPEYGGGGGGGAGGYGAILTGIGPSTNTGTIAGGDGGSGGAAGASNAGDGGDGGVGILASGSGVSIDNSGSILGGAGAAGGSSPVAGRNGKSGNGGAGIVFTGSGASLINSGSIVGGAGATAAVGVSGANLTITNSGRIEGGRQGSAVANAIQFTGGVNTLTNLSGASYAGKIIAFSRADSMIFDGAGNTSFTIADAVGFGSFTKKGTGAWALAGRATGDATWTIEAGTLSVGDGALGSGALTMRGGTLQNAGNYTLAQAITLAGPATFDTNGSTALLQGTLTGSGSLVKQGTGTLILAQAASHSGGTTIAAGTLQIGNGGTSGSLAGTILNNGELAFNRSDAIAYTAITGSGAVRKLGIGMLTLFGANTYLGDTSVEAGVLNVTGSLVSSVTVRGGAALIGNGSIGDATIGTAALVSPGAGTLTVAGNLAFDPFGVYAVTTGATTASLLQVGGSATVAAPGQSGGIVVVTPLPGAAALPHSYTIISATAGVSGRFSGLINGSPLITSTLRYAGNSVIVDVTAADYGRVATTPNQNAVAGVLNIADDNATGDFATVTAALSQLTAANAAQIFAALSGQSYSGFGSVAVQGAQTFMNAFSQQAGGGKGGGSIALAEACEASCDTVTGARWGAWGGGLGAFGTVAGDANASGITYNLGGFAAGLDYRFTPDFVAGIAIGYSAATLHAQGSSGQGNTGTAQFSLYGEYTMGDAYLDALAGYARSDNRMTRQIVIPGLNLRTAYGQTTADQLFGQLEAGYKVTVAPSFGGFVTPFARLQASTSTQAGFTETGADSLNLTIASQTTNSLRTVLGAQLGAALDAGFRDKLALTLRLGWSHEFADLNRPVTAAFAGAPSLAFTTQGAVAPRDGVVLGLGLNTAVGESTSLYFRYDGDLAGANTSHILSAGVRMVW